MSLPVDVINYRFQKTECVECLFCTLQDVLGDVFLEPCINNKELDFKANTNAGPKSANKYNCMQYAHYNTVSLFNGNTEGVFRVVTHKKGRNRRNFQNDVSVNKQHRAAKN